jgi:protein-S-isoprenylcysteine O-methyltransferase Ste14
LVIKGFGAPFAIVSSRRIAHEWLYERTRNPMVLVLILFLISFGFFSNSLFIIFWTLLLVAPSFVIFLKIYEEKELELRFGESYLDYKRNTPFLLPSINRSDI